MSEIERAAPGMFPAMTVRLLCSLAVGSTLACASCQPAPSTPPTSPPTASAAPSEPRAADPAEPESEVPAPQPIFDVVVSSQCRDAWHAKLHLADEEGAPQGPREFDVVASQSTTVQLRRGDSILFTTLRGGIMAVDFEAHDPAYDARVEVSAECSGVKNTTVRRSDAASAAPAQAG